MDPESPGGRGHGGASEGWADGFEEVSVTVLISFIAVK